MGGDNKVEPLQHVIKDNMLASSLAGWLAGWLDHAGSQHQSLCLNPDKMGTILTSLNGSVFCDALIFEAKRLKPKEAC